MYQVIYRGDKWALRKSGASRATKLFDKQQQAIDFWKDRYSKPQGSTLHVHNQDGTVRYKTSRCICGILRPA